MEPYLRNVLRRYAEHACNPGRTTIAAWRLTRSGIRKQWDRDAELIWRMDIAALLRRLPDPTHTILLLVHGIGYSAQAAAILVSQSYTQTRADLRIAEERFSELHAAYEAGELPPARRRCSGRVQ
ncbi:hypothetical protein [Paracidobacterium acidisoli]|uniref:RNA polymerase sigma factor 70 region 4 type 2 domain-containing protein n=1 Tax=Paracidobacterium acidisoli TaxID=2303751 RepID=A0A372ILR1_9BACT|nr:hypothetical protein [Paracidobacterium acidisoli]MBT9332482.1 hypothetical protein [Paracidobacterium acidisoli]